MTDGPDDTIARRALAEQCASGGHPLTREEGRPGEWWRVCACGAERDLAYFESPSSLRRAVVRGGEAEPASPPAPVPTTPRPLGSPPGDALARYRGSLLGLAVGDALGTTLEFSAPDTFTPITDLAGGGPFGLRPGEWTDDTAMALCLAESLIECRGFDPVDQVRRYVRWYREGHLSSTGACFDIGNTVRAALERFERTGEAYSGSTDPATAGNGSLMRLAPVPLAFARDPGEAVARAAESSRTTHGALEAVDACRYLAALIVGALQGRSKAELLGDTFEPVAGLWAAPLAPRIAEIAAGSFRHREPPAVRGTGYVVACLEAALWAFHRTETFREGALVAVNLGEDADTTGAVYGQLAGAYYGEAGIPEAWRQRLARRETIEAYAEGLWRLANSECP